MRPRTLRLSGRPARRGRQRGAALLMAMLIVTLVATMAAAMVWQQWRAVQVEEAERAQSQAQWILNGALDWARLILREDARNGGADHLGEPWAVPLAEARLSTFLAADRDRSDDAPDAFLSGLIRDAQGRYNLRNLLAQGRVQPTELATLRTLCELAGVTPGVADQLAEGLRLASPIAAAAPPGAAGPGTGTAPAPATRDAPAPLLPPSLELATWLGVDAQSLARLAEHAVLLPRGTPLNLNTASKEAIASVLGVSLANAQCLVQQRQRTPLKGIQDAGTCVPANVLTTHGARIGVASNFFEITGSLRTQALRVTQRSLVEKSGPPRLEVRVLSTERIRTEQDVAVSLQQ